MKKMRPPIFEELVVESIGFEGKAIARKDGLVYFVEGGVPGDTVRAQILKKKRRYTIARTLEILQPSPARTEPPCKYFGDCGGCKWQHLVYEEQIRWKQRHVQDAFERIGKIPFGEIASTLPAPQQFAYRNKMEFSFSNFRWLTRAEIDSALDMQRDFAVGLHAPGRFDKVLDIQECFLQPQIGNELLGYIRAAALERKVTAFETRHHTGFLRNAVLRFSEAAGQCMVILVTSPPKERADFAMIEWLEQEFPALAPQSTTIVHAVSTSKASVAIGEPRVIQGDGYLVDETLGVRFRISPFSFFQTNVQQAERLFTLALDYADIAPDSVVWDLYCGAGSITLCAAGRARRVIGIELSESAIADAQYNAALNAIDNVEFHAADMKLALSDEFIDRVEKPDVIIVDPPRAGMHADVIATLGRIQAPRIMYVSCNPATQARDCAMLHQWYDIEKIHPVDMFPNTYHIECVARLTLR